MVNVSDRIEACILNFAENQKKKIKRKERKGEEEEEEEWEEWGGEKKGQSQKEKIKGEK